MEKTGIEKWGAKMVTHVYSTLCNLPEELCDLVINTVAVPLADLLESYTSVDIDALLDETLEGGHMPALEQPVGASCSVGAIVEKLAIPRQVALGLLDKWNERIQGAMYDAGLRMIEEIYEEEYHIEPPDPSTPSSSDQSDELADLFG